MSFKLAFLHLEVTVALIIVLGLYSVKLYADHVRPDGPEPPWGAPTQTAKYTALNVAKNNATATSRRPVAGPTDYLRIVQQALQTKQKEDPIYLGIEVSSVSVVGELLTLEATCTRERHRVDIREIAFEALSAAGVQIKDEGHNDHRIKKKE
jgi:hypothetical protein